jgi:uncharacterized protein (DUF1778 family)
MGRPRSDNPAEKWVGVRVSDDERTVIKRAADARGLTISAFLRQSMNEAIRSRRPISA